MILWTKSLYKDRRRLFFSLITFFGIILCGLGNDLCMELRLS